MSEQTMERATISREDVILALYRAYRTYYRIERKGRGSMPATPTTRVLAWYRVLERTQGNIGLAVIAGHEPFALDVAVGRAVDRHIDRCNERDNAERS